MQHRKNMSRNRVLFVLGALSVLLHPRPASAQIVTGRVTASSLNVRAGSSSDFDVVEVVHEGELLTIVDDVPWWYEVRTPSGQPGFAFKRWVELVLTPTTRGLRIVHFQVDQGDATLVVSSVGQAMLIDSGQFPRHANRIINYLRENNLVLTHTVVTHYDADHIGALDRVISGPDDEPGVAGVDDDGDGEIDDRFTAGEYGAAGSDDLKPTVAAFDRGDEEIGDTNAIKEYLAAVSERRAVAPTGVSLEDFLFQQTIDLGDPSLTIRFVAANGRLPDGTTVGSLDENGRSLAVLIEYGGFDYLIAGDLTGGGAGTADVESTLAGHLSGQNIDVLHANHHGSVTSNNAAFLREIEPEIVIISAGDSASCVPGFNRFGHPAQETLTSLSQGPPPPSIPAVYQTNEGGARPESASDCTARPSQTFPRDYDGISRTFASDDILIETDGVTYSVSITGVSESFDVDD